MTRSRAVALTAVVLLVALAAASAAGLAVLGGSGGTASSRSAETAADNGADPGRAPAGTPPNRPVRRYVALGDSFTAGPLIPYVDATLTRCLRSSANYPAVLGRWLGARQMVDRSCSGADTGDLGQQQSALTADTDLVTVGMGGNDFGIFGLLASRCPGVAGAEPLGSPCRDLFARPDGTDSMLARTVRVERRLVAGLRGVIEAAPGAAIAVVGYPRLVPPSGTCTALPFAVADYPWVDRVERALNEALARAAMVVGALFVDTYTGSRGHDVCAGGDAWVNGRRTVATRALAFHPYAAGMRATAAQVHARLTGSRPSPAMVRGAERRAGVRPPGTLSLREQRVVAALFTAA